MTAAPNEYNPGEGVAPTSDELDTHTARALPPTALRYLAKTTSRTRSDGTSYDLVTDIEAAEAERYACELFGVPFNDEIYADHGDGGSDFELAGFTVEVVWLGMFDGRPRHHPEPDGRVWNLIIDPEQPQRHADIYLVVAGSRSEGHYLVGGTFHHVFVSQARLRVFQGQHPKWGLPVNQLLPAHDILWWWEKVRD